ncbi:MAG TPA: signal peptidase I [Bacteroidetes bacterium]|nr:signal peptidase I [Bacteroidota bacterium]
MNLNFFKKENVKKSKKQPEKSKLREYTDAIIFAVIAATILRIFVVQAFRIPTGSMEKTLMVGDFLLVNKFIYGVRTPDKIPLINVKIPWVRLPALKKPKKGDIVVFKYPRNPDQDYIKRCVAVGGDTLQIIDKQVFINGKRFTDPPHLQHIDPYTMPKGQLQYDIVPSGAGNRDNYGPVIVPPHHYFMMGDNRDNSLDSRYWGFLPEENIVGEALILYFSWNKNAPLYQFYKKIRWSRIGDLIK